MRMTNKIMQNNSLYNINNNKVLQDKLSTQMSTNKKITRPSDDPVIAIRALRLRSDVSQIKQFYEKNAPDASSWLKVTSDALQTTTEVINSLVEQCNKGSSKTMGADELDILITELKSLRDEFYATGNVDYAGRYVFTGYRTDTPLIYTEDTKQDILITENLKGIGAIDTINYTDTGKLAGLNVGTHDFSNATGTAAETAENISSEDIYRIRLSYDQLKGGSKPALKYNFTAGNPAGDDLINPADIETISLTDATRDPYEFASNPTNAGKAVFIPETGELLIGKDLYDDLTTATPPATDPKLTADTEIKVTYNKDSWEKGDLRPEHYFTCTDQGTGVVYNPNGVEQIIEYDVGYNQKIRINTQASEVFTPDMNRNVEDLEKALLDLKEMEKVKKELDKKLSGLKEDDPEYKNVKDTCEAADKALTSIRENIQKKFEEMNTNVKGMLDITNIAITDNGARGSRLDLVTNRLMTQKTTFETLQSANEDVDITEVTIQLTSMNNSYQSALMATSKILQNSLMNYI